MCGRSSPEDHTKHRTGGQSSRNRTAPGCTFYRNLHDHHIVPRSAGGSDDLSNRTTLCAWHHLRAVHGGLANATGQAPDSIDWELGLKPAARPLMRTRRDRYV